eukprot:snap_masked-scaffold_16-processed-gene-1.47-mRNA-1 protein AED:1.00 eAED:1.00 QI:0/0/0/0/1/1/3/0/362
MYVLHVIDLRSNILKTLLTNNAAFSYEYEENTEEIRVATIGIFQSTYNPNNLDETQLQAATLSLEKIEHSTIGFPLLFPAQSHLAGDVFSFILENISSVSGFQLQTEEALSDPLQAFTNLTFTTCNQSADSAPAGAILFHYIGSAATAAAQLSQCTSSLEAFSSLEESEKLSQVLNATEYSCLITGFNTFSELVNLQLVYSDFPVICGDGGLTVEECILVELSGALESVQNEILSDSASFQNQDVCSITEIYSTKLTYLLFMRSILTRTDDEDLKIYGEELNLVSNLFSDLEEDTNSTAVDILLQSTIISSLSLDLPQEINEEYLPCKIVYFVDEDDTNSCTLRKFLQKSVDMNTDTDSLEI